LNNKSSIFNEGKSKRISIKNSKGDIIFYDGPENDYGIYTRNATRQYRNSIETKGQGKKHINFLKEDENNFRRSNPRNVRYNTKKAISYHSYKNQESKMDHINELDEETNYEDDFEIKSKK